MSDSKMAWLYGEPVLNYLTSQVSSNAFTVTNEADGLKMTLGSNGGPQLVLEGLALDGPGGELHLTPGGVPLILELFGGFQLELAAFDLAIQNGSFTTSSISARLTIPAFTDNGNFRKVDVELSLRPDQSVALSLALQQSDPSQMTTDGLVRLTYSLGQGVSFELHLDALELTTKETETSGNYQLVLGGKLLLSTPGLSWPELQVKGLRLDSTGKFELEGGGGWIDLPEQIALDFFGFHLGLQKLGFGNGADGTPWVGFNGDLHLVEGLPLGGAVQGLKLNLATGALTFNGVAVSFEIPGVLAFEGELSHIQAQSAYDIQLAGLPASLGSLTPINLFAGGVRVNLEAIPGLEVAGQLIIGHFQNTPVFFLSLDIELPVGLPIFTDISLYGLQGMFASNLRPDPAKNGLDWWEWYATGINGSQPFDATDVQKWLPYPRPGALALGAGATLGTSADDGFTASAAITLVLLLPGPVISFIGRANILSKRMNGPSEGAEFEAMATYDGEAGTFDLAIQADYQIPVVLDIEANAELFAGASQGWYLALGKPPKDKRVKAKIFDVFEMDSYLVVSDKGLMVGTYVGYQKEWGFGPLGVSLNGYLAAAAAIQWSPLQMAGGIKLHGEVELEAFGIGLGLSISALLTGSAPHPYHVYGEFEVGLDLPWPLPDVSATISLEWGSDDGSIPPAPLALSTVEAVMGDHTGSGVHTEHYTLLAHRAGGPDPQKNGDLVYDQGTPGILNASAEFKAKYATTLAGALDSLALPPSPGTFSSGGSNISAGPGLAPNEISTEQFATVIPQDSQFILNFAHPVYDKLGLANGAANIPDDLEQATVASGLVGEDPYFQNPQSQVAWQYRHTLEQVVLFQRDFGNWQAVASLPDSSSTFIKLAGAWYSPDERNKLGPNTKLKLIPHRLTAQGPEAILPNISALYALKIVTRVATRRVGDTGDYQPVEGASPVVEFAYFQTAGGPGTAVLDPSMVLPGQKVPPIPAVLPPHPVLAKNAGTSSSAFPRGGQLLNLTTYAQWSWPENGAVAAYYGYDLNVEFNESYVNLLYAPFQDVGSPLKDEPYLNLRCVDRNYRHVKLNTNTTHVPSILRQSAIGGAVEEMGQPLSLTNATAGGGDNTGGSQDIAWEGGSLSPTVAKELLDLLQQPSVAIEPQLTTVNKDASVVTHSSLSEKASEFLAEVGRRSGLAIDPALLFSSSGGVSPEIRAAILAEISEEQAARQLKELWWQPLHPNTRYILDLIAIRESTHSDEIIPPRLAVSPDAVAELKELIKTFTDLDAYTSLLQVHFTTSRYATFSDQLAGILAQSSSNTRSSGRQYLSLLNDLQGWLDNTNANQENLVQAYQQAREQLAALVANFDPVGANLPGVALPPGQNELRESRGQVEQAWQAFSHQTITRFDTLVQALGRADLVSKERTALPLQTELSQFVDDAGSIMALLVESPEPLPWRRLWQWVQLEPVIGAGPNESPSPLPGLEVRVLWSDDGTRALLIPQGQPVPQRSYKLVFTFQGNIGAEAPCITRQGSGVIEQVELPPLVLNQQPGAVTVPPPPPR